MVGKLLTLLVLSGAAVTLGAGTFVPTSAADDDASTPVTLPDAPLTFDLATPIPHRERIEPTMPPSPSCDERPAVRGEARTTIQSAYAASHAAIDRLHAERGPRYGETLTGADAMLRQIAETADRAIVDLAPCADVLVHQVAERATAAMETVVSVTAGATAPTPPPREKPTATRKPKSTASTCDGRAAAATKQLTASFDAFHSANDKLLSEARASTSAAAAVKSADKLIHSTYESTKTRILKAGCADGAGTALAASAANTFEGAYEAAKGAVAGQKRR